MIGFIFIIASLLSEIASDSSVFVESVLKDTVELRCYVDVFYVHPPGFGQHDIHSIDVDSVVFISKHNKHSYNPEKISDPVHFYLWQKYQDIIIKEASNKASQSNYDCQRVKYFGKITLLPGTMSSQMMRKMHQLSHRLTQRKWQRKWRLSFLSPNQLHKAREWVLCHLNYKSEGVDSLFIVECFHPFSWDETIYVYNPEHQKVSGWFFAHENNSAMPEPIPTDEKTMDIIQNMVYSNLGNQSIPLYYHKKENEDSIYARLYTVLLIIFDGNSFYPSSYELYNDNPHDEKELWLL